MGPIGISLRATLVRVWDRSNNPHSTVRKGSALPKRFLTLIELADYLDVPGEDLLQWIQEEDNGGFPGIRIGEEWLVPLDEVPDWLLRLIK